MTPCLEYPNAQLTQNLNNLFAFIFDKTSLIPGIQNSWLN